MNTSNDFSGLMDSFKALIGSPELVFQILDSFPVPIEVFTADGTAIFANRAVREVFHFQNLDKLLGKYNIHQDPLNYEIFGQEIMDRALRGEFFTVPDVPIPIQDTVDRGVVDVKTYEAATVHFTFLPVWDGDAFLYALCIFMPKHVYTGNPKVAQAKKHIEEHWRDPFDADVVAKAVGLSTSHFHMLFKKSAGMTLYDYYKNVKVEHIKEKLVDKSLSIAEAFSLCGEDNRGSFARIFKKLTGMTPKEYRERLQH